MDNDESSLTFDFEEVLDGGNAVVAAPSSRAESSGSSGPAADSGSSRQVVCRHWMRGLCMKDKECRFLHQLDMDRLQVCHFFSENGYCREKEECKFKHIDPVVKRCEMYDMGFCPNGPFCRYKHVKLPGPPPPPEEVIRRLQQMNMFNHGSSNIFYQQGGNNYGPVQHNHNLAASGTHIMQQPAAHHVQTVNPQHVPPPPPPPQQLQQNAQVQGAPNGSSNQATISANPPPQGKSSAFKVKLRYSVRYIKGRVKVTSRVGCYIAGVNWKYAKLYYDQNILLQWLKAALDAAEAKDEELNAEGLLPVGSADDSQDIVLLRI